MKHLVSGLCLAGSLVFPLLAATASASAQSIPPTTSAYIYVQSKGPSGPVEGFRTDSSGKLSSLPGSPFTLNGHIVGSYGRRFVSMGQSNIYSYAVGTYGSVASPWLQDPYTAYFGSQCGTGTNGVHTGEFDPSGNYAYLLLQNGGASGCAAYQSFIVNNVELDGVVEESVPSGSVASLPAILGNETFAYADNYHNQSSSMFGFLRNSSGILQTMQFTETDPTLQGSSKNYTAWHPSASPTGNYLVVQLLPHGSSFPQLGTYTVDGRGDISSTNTSSDMPTSPFTNIQTVFSRSGKYLAAYADNGKTAGGNGIQLYKFNGASPLTAYQKVLNGTPIDKVLWDNSDHLYAISKSAGKLYVFKVSSTAVTETSSETVASPFDMVVTSNPNPSNASVQFQANLFSLGDGNTYVDGSVSIDVLGNLSLNFTRQEPYQNYVLRFCPAVALSDTKPSPCFIVANTSSDSNGDGTIVTKFPRSGNWAGEFALLSSNSQVTLMSRVYPNLLDQAYMATLLPETKTNGGVLTPGISAQDPLTAGTVSFVNNEVLFSLSGISRDTTYQIIQTDGNLVGGIQSHDVQSFTSDGSGNGNGVVNLGAIGSEIGDVFQVHGGSGAGYIGGFKVP